MIQAWRVALVLPTLFHALISRNASRNKRDLNMGHENQRRDIREAIRFSVSSFSLPPVNLTLLPHFVT